MKPPNLQTGARYRARIIVDDGGTGLATSEKVSSAFNGIGFEDVEVWDRPDELPAEWPADHREDPDVFLLSVFWGEGTWGGEDGQKAIVKGDNWAIDRIWKVQDSPEQPEPPAPGPLDPIFEQETPTSKYAWVPIASVTAVNWFATWLWIKAGKNR